MAGATHDANGRVDDFRGFDGSDISYFRNRRGNKLAIHTCAPSGPHKGIALVFHGYAVQTMFPSATWSAEVMYREGLICYGVDMIGHGKSDGTPGLLPSLKHMTEDCLDALEEVRKRNPGAKVFLSGSSMGGSLVLDLAMHADDLAGAVCLSPMCAMLKPLGFIALLILRILAFLFPTRAPIKTNIYQLEIQYADPARREECRQAFQFLGNIPLRSMVTLIDLCAKIETKMTQVVCPLWVAVSKDDQVVDTAGTIRAFNRASTPTEDKVLKVYNTVGHTPLGESEPLRSQVLDDIRTWLRSRLQA